MVPDASPSGGCIATIRHAVHPSDRKHYFSSTLRHPSGRGKFIAKDIARRCCQGGLSREVDECSLLVDNGMRIR
jgi:hypothetical protein